MVFRKIDTEEDSTPTILSKAREKISEKTTILLMLAMLLTLLTRSLASLQSTRVTKKLIFLKRLEILSKFNLCKAHFTREIRELSLGVKIIYLTKLLWFLIKDLTEPIRLQGWIVDLVSQWLISRGLRTHLMTNIFMKHLLSVAKWLALIQGTNLKILKFQWTFMLIAPRISKYCLEFSLSLADQHSNLFAGLRYSLQVSFSNDLSKFHHLLPSE